MLVTILAVVSVVFGILAVFAGVSLIPSLGLYPRDPGSKAGLLSAIGSIGLVGGLLFLAAAAGLWRVARWGWTLGLVGSILTLVAGIWAYITVVDPLMPLAEIVVALLMLGVLVAGRSSFRTASAVPPGSS